MTHNKTASANIGNSIWRTEVDGIYLFILSTTGQQRHGRLG